MFEFRQFSVLLLATMASVTAMNAMAQEATASYVIDTEVKFTTDQRTRGISDSLNGPSAKVSVQAAHESGLIALAEFASVSRDQFMDGTGLGVTLAAGYRFGDPEGWHYGVGLAREMFPGSRFDAPQGFDLNTGTPTDFRSGNYDSSFAVLEVGYGAIEGRLMNVISKSYRGANTGSVCGTMLALMADPTEGLDCYARGVHGSRGSWLLDLDYKYKLAPNTTLTLHVGKQKVKNFKEADFTDERIGIAHKQWGYEWGAEWVMTQTKVRELYLAQDGDRLRKTDNDRLVLSVSRKF